MTPLMMILCTIALVITIKAQVLQYNLSASAVLDVGTNFNLSLSILPAKGTMSINITGPANTWFGVGFGNTIMSNTYVIVSSAECQENKLGDGHNYGQQLNSTINVVHNNVNNPIRRVYITRNITMDNPNYFSFPTWTSAINIIYATGSSDTFSSSSTMGSVYSTKKLQISNGLSNNLTANASELALGSQIILNSMAIYPDEDIVQINMTGPSDVYFGIGFNETVMDGTYAIICNASDCYENQLGYHSYGTSLKSTTNVIYNNNTNGKRNVVINRKRIISNANNTDFSKYFVFPNDTATVPIIYAIGQSNTWSSDSWMSSDNTTYGHEYIEFDLPVKAWTVMAHQPLFSEVHQMVDIQIHPLDDEVDIKLTGPDDKWFGIGFNTTMMGNTYSIICSNEALCFEQLLGEGNVGQRFYQQMIKTVNDTKINGIRTVNLKRKQIITRDDDNNYANWYSFPSLPTAIPIIYAYGTNNIFITNQSSMGDAHVAALTFSNKTNRHNINASLDLFPEVNQTVNISIYPDNNNVEIIFSGPPKVWYGIGFDSNVMENTYAIIVDATNNANEYILGQDEGGNKLSESNIEINSDVVIDGVRKVNITRSVSVLNPMAYDFPVSPINVSIIAAYGTPGPYNASDASMAGHKYNIFLDFKKFNGSSGGNTTNGTNCKPGISYYGTSGNVGNGFTIGLYIYCDRKTIELHVDYTSYSPNWFGITFNTKMAGSQNATVFTTNKPGQTTRPLALYSYELGAEDISKVIYHPERNWNKLSQTVGGHKVSIQYEHSLIGTPWSIYTNEIQFRYAWGTSQQGVVLQQHTDKSYSKIWKFDLATGVISSSGENTGIKTAHGIIMIISWSILTTIGIFSSRYRFILYQKSKSKAMWFFVHRGVQVSVVILVLIGFGIAIYFTQDDGDEHFSNNHEKIGLTVVILAFLQPINACFRPHPPKKGKQKSTGRLLWEIIHKSFGYTTWILAQIAIYFGIKQLTSDKRYIVAFIIWIGCVLCVFILLSLYNIFCFFNIRNESNNINKRHTQNKGLLSPADSSPNNSMIGASPNNSDRSDS